MEDGTNSIFKLNFYEILSYVNQNQPCNKSAIYDHLGGSSQTRIRIVNELVELGLIEEVKSGLYNKKTIALTEKGKEILNEMQRIMAIMNGEIVPNERNHGTPSAHDAKAGGE